MWFGWNRPQYIFAPDAGCDAVPFRDTSYDGSYDATATEGLSRLAV